MWQAPLWRQDLLMDKLSVRWFTRDLVYSRGSLVVKQSSGDIQFLHRMPNPYWYFYIPVLSISERKVLHFLILLCIYFPVVLPISVSRIWGFRWFHKCIRLLYLLDELTNLGWPFFCLPQPTIDVYKKHTLNIVTVTIVN